LLVQIDTKNFRYEKGFQKIADSEKIIRWKSFYRKKFIENYSYYINLSKKGKIYWKRKQLVCLCRTSPCKSNGLKKYKNM